MEHGTDHQPEQGERREHAQSALSNGSSHWLREHCSLVSQWPLLGERQRRQARHDLAILTGRLVPEHRELEVWSHASRPRWRYKLIIREYF